MVVTAVVAKEIGDMGTSALLDTEGPPLRVGQKAEGLGEQLGRLAGQDHMPDCVKEGLAHVGFACCQIP